MDLLPRVVAAFEAFSTKVYFDAAGLPTIGFGHLIKPGENFEAPVSREQALFLLEGDLAIAKHGVDAVMQGCLLANHERDALTSFVFNLGRKALLDSTLRQRIIGSDRRGAAAEFLRWIYATDPKSGAMRQLPGLIRRRHCESIWFLGAAPATVAWIAGIKLEEE